MTISAPGLNSNPFRYSAKFKPRLNIRFLISPSRFEKKFQIKLFAPISSVVDQYKGDGEKIRAIFCCLGPPTGRLRFSILLIP